MLYYQFKGKKYIVPKTWFMPLLALVATVLTAIVYSVFTLYGLIGVGIFIAMLIEIHTSTGSLRLIKNSKVRDILVTMMAITSGIFTIFTIFTLV